METLRRRVNNQYMNIRHRIPFDLLKFTDKADWRFRASFLLLLNRKNRFLLNEFAAYSLVCKLKRVWIEPYLTEQFKVKQEGKIIAEHKIRLPLSNPWDYWRSVRARLLIPDGVKTSTSRILRHMKTDKVKDIQATCAVITYLESQKTKKISQTTIANIFRIPLSRFRMELSSYKIND